jgi:excisionase family DNA binding protein
MASRHTDFAPLNETRRSEILTISEVATILRCSKAHIHNLIGGRVRGLNALPAVHLGRRSLVRRESLNQWLELNERRVAMIRSPESIAVDARKDYCA